MSHDVPRPIDIFCGSIGRTGKLRAMIESVEATGYPARVCVGAGDVATVDLCTSLDAALGADIACVYSSEANRLVGSTAPLNHVVESLVRRDALFCTDDCLFDSDSLHIAVETLDRHFPDGDGVVGFAQDNIDGGYPLAFPLFGRAFMRRFEGLQTFFFPGYHHLYNDAEMGLTIACLGNWIYEPKATLRHMHPEFGGGEMDRTHHRALTHQDRDREVWRERRARGALWGIDDKAREVETPAPGCAPGVRCATDG